MQKSFGLELYPELTSLTTCADQSIVYIRVFAVLRFLTTVIQTPQMCALFASAFQEFKDPGRMPHSRFSGGSSGCGESSAVGAGRVCTQRGDGAGVTEVSSGSV